MAAPARTPSTDQTLRAVDPQHREDAAARAPRAVSTHLAAAGRRPDSVTARPGGALSAGPGGVLGALLASASGDELDALAAALAPRLAAAPAGPSDGLGGWLDTRAAEAYAGLSRGRLDDLKRLGKISPAGYDGRKPMYRRSDLDAYLEAGSGRVR